MPSDESLFVLDRASLSRREASLLARLEAEYTPQLVADVLAPLVEQTCPVSLRCLDWAVTNWSKQHNVVCSSSVPGQVTNVHHAYRATLTFWTRKLFDPFRRRSRIGVRLGDGTVVDTTLGQANFALWAYRTGVLAYVLGHVETIEADMNAVAQKHKKERREAARKGMRRKRTELTASPRSMCVAYVAPSRVEF
jgi:hypothetical protein